jgi:hypothetical protein
MQDNFPLPTASRPALDHPASNPVDTGEGGNSLENIPGGKGRPARTADNLTAICESTF